MLRWPPREEVLAAARDWAAWLVGAFPEVAAVGLFGSYARGKPSFGSDLDLVVLLHRSEVPFERRTLEWRSEELPVDADVLAYTLREWRDLVERPGFGASLREEVRWLEGQAPS